MDKNFALEEHIAWHRESQRVFDEAVEMYSRIDRELSDKLFYPPEKRYKGVSQQTLQAIKEIEKKQEKERREIVERRYRNNSCSEIPNNCCKKCNSCEAYSLMLYISANINYTKPPTLFTESFICPTGKKF